MSNINYYFSHPDIGIRKAIVETHAELSKSNKTIYQNPPYKISLYKSFLYRRNIEFFLYEVAFKMETFTEIERLKKLEVKHSRELILSTFGHYTDAAIVLFTLPKILHIKPEWKYKYKMIYLPYIPISDFKPRIAWLLATYFLLKFDSIVPNLLLCLYSPSFLADLQIGEDFELGYWTTKFAKSL